LIALERLVTHLLRRGLKVYDCYLGRYIFDERALEATRRAIEG
jgi:hypothetical protein